MPRPSKPWYRRSKGAWYVTVNGSKVRLGVKGREDRKQALAAWHELLARGGENEVLASEPSVKEVVTGPPADCEGRVKPNTLALDKHFLLPFAALRRYAGKPASALAPTDAEMYSRKPSWSAATRADFLMALKTAMQFGVRSRIVKADPVEGVNVPARPSRGPKALISDDEHARLVSLASPCRRSPGPQPRRRRIAALEPLDEVDVQAGPLGQGGW